MLYTIVGNDEDFLNDLPKEGSREQTWKQSLHTECSAKSRELLENPRAFSHSDPAGPTGDHAGVTGKKGTCAAVGRREGVG